MGWWGMAPPARDMEFKPDYFFLQLYVFARQRKMPQSLTCPSKKRMANLMRMNLCPMSKIPRHSIHFVLQIPETNSWSIDCWQYRTIQHTLDKGSLSPSVENGTNVPCWPSIGQCVRTMKHVSAINGVFPMADKDTNSTITQRKGRMVTMDIWVCYIYKEKRRTQLSLLP